MNSYEWVGVLAGICTTAAFAPQAVVTLKSRRVADISLAMYVAFTAGVALWIVYGVAIGSASIVIFNAITFILAGSVLAMKIAFGRGEAGKRR